MHFVVQGPFMTVLWTQWRWSKNEGVLCLPLQFITLFLFLLCRCWILNRNFILLLHNSDDWRSATVAIVCLWNTETLHCTAFSCLCCLHRGKDLVVVHDIYIFYYSVRFLFVHSLAICHCLRAWSTNLYTYYLLMSEAWTTHNLKNHMTTYVWLIKIYT